MLDITRFSHVNPEDKLNFVSGRGLPHRKSAMTKEERIGMAADLVTGKARLEPSLAQASWLMSVTPAQIRAELKARATANKNGSNGSISDEAVYFVDLWTALSTANREAAFRAMGVADIWDTLAKVID